MEVQKGFAEISGAKIYYEVAGEGFPLVMVHAGIANSRMWDDQFAFFAQHYKVLRYDLRGFGQSAPVAGEFYRYEELRALLDFLKIDRAYLMGCSKGGSICIDFAVSYPARVMALMTSGSAPSGFKFDAPPPPQWEEIMTQFNAGNLERVSELETQMWVDGRGRTPDQVAPAVRQKVYEMNLIVLKYEMMDLGKELPLQPPAFGRLNELQLPFLAIIGDLDTASATAAADYLATNIVGGRKIVMHGTAHLPNMEQPDEFNRHVQDFLAQS